MVFCSFNNCYFPVVHTVYMHILLIFHSHISPHRNFFHTRSQWAIHSFIHSFTRLESLCWVERTSSSFVWFYCCQCRRGALINIIVCKARAPILETAKIQKYERLKNLFECAVTKIYEYNTNEFKPVSCALDGCCCCCCCCCSCFCFDTFYGCDRPFNYQLHVILFILFLFVCAINRRRRFRKWYSTPPNRWFSDCNTCERVTIRFCFVPYEFNRKFEYFGAKRSELLVHIIKQ